MRVRPTLLAVALVLAGCSAVELSDYQGRYHALVAAKQNAGAETRRDGGPLGRYDAGRVLRSNADGDLLALADESVGAAGKAGDTETKIALHFLAAVAAWQSEAPGADARAAEVAVAGSELCRGFPAERFKPARDCAVLGTLHIVVAGENILGEIDARRRKNPLFTPLDPAGWAAIQDGSVRFRSNVVARFGDMDSHLRTIRGVDTTVVEWHVEAKKRLWCNYWQAVAFTVRNWKTNSPETESARAALTATAGEITALAQDNLGFDPSGIARYCRFAS